MIPCDNAQKAHRTKGERSEKYLAGAVAIATFLAYLPALRGQFVNWDDDIYVYENAHVRSLGAGFFRWAFTTFDAANWHPLTWLSHGLDVAIWGMNPFGHHLTSGLLHALNAFIVVLLAAKLVRLGEAGTEGRANASPLIAATATGLLFGLHPIHAESVAWIAERKEVLCAFFYLLSLLAYVDWASGKTSLLDLSRMGRRRFRSGYWLSLGFFLLALSAKPMAVSLPAVLFILDMKPLRRLRSRRELASSFGEKIPFLFFAAVGCILTLLAQRRAEAVVSTEVFSLPDRLVTAVQSLAAYLTSIFVPWNLSPFYPLEKAASFMGIPAVASILGVTAIVIACVVRWGHRDVWAAAFSYYFITIFPVLGLVQAGAQARADRYAYLPTLGPLFLLGLAVALAWRKTAALGRKASASRIAYCSIAVAGLAGLTWMTSVQIGVWRTSLSLWNEVIRKEPASAPFAYYNRAQAFMSLGQLDAAVDDYSTAFRLNPRYDAAVYNRGVAFERMGQAQRAARDYQTAIRINVNNFKALNNLGALYGRSGALEQAISAFSQAILANPSFVDPYINRGVTYAMQRKLDEAILDFSRGIELDPVSAIAYFQRGNAYLALGKRELSSADLQKACELGFDVACKQLL